MQLFQKTSIKGKQTLIVLMTSGAALLLACVAFASYEVTTFRTTMKQNLSTLAEIIGDNSSAALDFGDPKAAKETLSALRAEPNIIGGCIYNSKGEIFAVYERSGDSATFVPPPLHDDNGNFSKDSLHVFRPIVRGGERIGTVYVVSDLNALYTRLDKYALIAIGVFFAAGLVAFAVSARLQRLISGPILSLVETARSVTLEKNYSVRASKQNEDELGVLIDAFNEMLKQIQERDAALQKTHVELEQRVVERTQEVVNSLSLMHATLESTTDGILAVDRNGKVTGFNQKFLDMWRIPREATEPEYPTPLKELVLPQLKDPKTFLAKIKALYADMEIESFDLLEFKDGRIFERYSKPQRIGEKSIGRVWSFRDITERKRAEIELAYERDLLRTLLDNSPDLIYFKDAKSRFLKVSQSMVKAFGVSNADEMIGRTDFDFHTEKRARAAFEDEQKIIRTGHSLLDKIEKEVNKNHPEGWMLTSKMPLHDKRGKIIGTFGISKDITAIKEAEAKLEEMHRQLLETSRRAGMAEVATSVLHNVGNVLNSINVSSTLISDRVRKSKVANLPKVVAMMNEHSSDLGVFLSSDPKGKQVPGYLGQLADHLVSEQATVLEEIILLHKNIEHIKDIVLMQQSYARISGVAETVKITDLVEDALRMNVGALLRHNVKVIREYDEVPPIDIEKHKVLQILVNLIRNAKYACDESAREDKQMTVRIARIADRIKIAVIDNGIGILAENLTRIFNHGFTTRKDGHGFGLHSAVLAAMEMGGSLSAHSDGPGRGAIFTLELPYKPHENPHA